jgi:hypothetical protein
MFVHRGAFFSRTVYKYCTLHYTTLLHYTLHRNTPHCILHYTSLQPHRQNTLHCTIHRTALHTTPHYTLHTGLQNNPNCGKLNALRGRCFYELRRFGDAHVCFTRAVECGEPSKGVCVCVCEHVICMYTFNGKMHIGI